jgi:hypothetical protein
MRKRLFVALAFLALGGFGFQTASAQWPDGLPRIPRPGKPKPKPTPTPAEMAQPAPSGGTQPATQPLPDAPAATNPAPPAAALRPQAGGITLTKTLIRFWPYTLTSYQGNYNNVWSWIPTVRFTTEGGALPSGGQYYVEVAQPGGAAWVKLKCVNTTIGGPSFECGDRNDLEKSGTLATGVFPFVIKMRNALEGTEKTLFTGRAKVEKVLSNEVGPQSVKKFVYYANQDWNLPVGHVYIGSDDHLNVRFWIRGEGAGGLEAHPFYRGEEVGWYQEHGYQYGGASCSPDIEYFPTQSAGAGAPQGAKWARVNCAFGSVVTKPAKNVPQWHVLGANPGEYEIKVLRNKRLVRSIKFSIGPDGKIVDNRIASGNGMAWDDFIFVPVTIIGDQDGTWDRNAWKTEAFYGHPLAGFSWPPQ